MDKRNMMDTKECTMDTREYLVAGLKQAYSTINNLNATTRKISAAKAILLMKRDQVRHEMDGLTRRLTAMLAIMHSNLEKEISMIVRSKTEYLENWEQHVFQTICKIGEVCIETEHALKIENEQLMEVNAQKLKKQLQILCHAGLDPDTATHFENSVKIEFVPGVLEEILEYSTLGDLLTSNLEDIRSKNTNLNSSSDSVHPSDDNNNQEAVSCTQTLESSECNKIHKKRYNKNQKSVDGNEPLQALSISESSDSTSEEISGQLVSTESSVKKNNLPPHDNSHNCKFNHMTDNISSKPPESSSRLNGAANLGVVVTEHHGCGDSSLVSGYPAMRRFPNANLLRVHDDVMISRPTLNTHSSIYTKGRGRSKQNSVELSSKINRASSNLDHSYESSSSEPATPEKIGSSPHKIPMTDAVSNVHLCCVEITQEPKSGEEQADKQVDKTGGDLSCVQSKSPGSIDDSQQSKNSENSTPNDCEMAQFDNSQDKAPDHIAAGNTQKAVAPQLNKLPVSNRKKIPNEDKCSSPIESWDKQTIEMKQAHQKGSSESIRLHYDTNSKNLDHQSSSENVSSLHKKHLEHAIVKTEPKNLEHQINEDSKDRESNRQMKTALSFPSSPLKNNGDFKKSVISGSMKNVLRKLIQANETQSTQQTGDANNNLAIRKEPSDNGSVLESKNSLTIKKESVDNIPVSSSKRNLAIKNKMQDETLVGVDKTEKETLDNMTHSGKMSADNTVVKSVNSSSDVCKSPMKSQDLLKDSAISSLQCKHGFGSPQKSAVSMYVPIHSVPPVHHVHPIKTMQLGIDLSQLVSSEPAKQVAQLGAPKIGTRPLFQYPIGITTNSHDEVIVCDSGAGMVRIFKYNCQLFMINNGKEGEKLVHPSAVVVNENDDIFVKDDNAIHVFDRDGNPLRSIGKKILRYPYGLVMTMDGKLVVVDVDKRRPTLFVFNQDGTVASSPVFTPLSRPKAGSKCRFLSLYQDRILVSDLGLSEMYLINLDGSLIRTFGTFGRSSGSFNEPSGVTVDSVGNWIVADSKNDRLQIFKPDGTFLSHLKLSSPICRPSDIHLTADGHLYVVNFLYHVVNVYKIPL